MNCAIKKTKSNKPPLRSKHMPHQNNPRCNWIENMDETSNDHHQNNGRHQQTPTKCTGEFEEGEGDLEVWKTFNRSFNQVQSVLDRNRALIQQVNENHQSRIPDNMVKNVALIREINGNISKVVSLYSDFSSNFSTVFRDQPSKNCKPESDTPPQPSWSFIYPFLLILFWRFLNRHAVI